MNISLSKPIYLQDFACYKPPNSYRLPKSMFLEVVFLATLFPDQNLRKIRFQ